MTQKDRQLLLKDLCARLPYGLIIQVSDWTPLDTELKVGHISQLMNEDLKIKPYLRSMSSMTEEEYKELKKISEYYGFAPFKYIDDWCPNYDMTDWLNAHHFDYRGLIPMGLALEASEGMYDIK